MYFRIIQNLSVNVNWDVLEVHEAENIHKNVMENMNVKSGMKCIKWNCLFCISFSQLV